MNTTFRILVAASSSIILGTAVSTAYSHEDTAKPWKTEQEPVDYELVTVAPKTESGNGSISAEEPDAKRTHGCHQWVQSGGTWYLIHC